MSKVLPGPKPSGSTKDIGSAIVEQPQSFPVVFDLGNRATGIAFFLTLTDLLRQSCSDATRRRHRGNIVQQVPNDFMARCGDAHTFSPLNERTNHSSAREGFARTGRTLNSHLPMVASAPFLLTEPLILLP